MGRLLDDPDTIPARLCRSGRRISVIPKAVTDAAVAVRPAAAGPGQGAGHAVTTHHSATHTASVASTDGMARSSRQIGFRVGRAPE